MTYIGDISAILGWLILGGALLSIGGWPAIAAYIGLTMMTVGVIVAIREVSR